MSQSETLGILDEIEALVSDKLQVVSYKWLSRNFLVSSDTAKRLLHEFLQTRQDGLQVVYSLSGCLKTNPLNYTFRLVPGPKLEEAKEDFDGSCSVQVYSVQACIPKDPVTIRNAEFVQAEELFGQPANVANCFRDNRFCGISNSFASRNAEGTSFTNSGPQLSALKASGSSTISKHENVTAPQLKKLQQMTQRDGQQPSDVSKDVKVEADVSADLHQVNKATADKGKVTAGTGGQKSKSTAGTGGSLQNLWGRASTKSRESKPIDSSAVTTAPDPTANEIAQLGAHEAAKLSSDDESEEVNFRRKSNGKAGRKRRVVLDFSDEENEYEDTVNLASPDFPKAESFLASKEDQQEEKRPKLDFDGAEEDKSEVKKENSIVEGISDPDTGRKLAVSSVEKVQSKEVSSNGKMTNAGPTSPKRKKTLKTRIDERGREVTEVVWEGEDTEKGKADTATMKKDNETTTGTLNRPSVSKKPPSAVASGPSNAGSKAGNKKGGSTDPKQGNILSFFKRV